MTKSWSLRRAATTATSTKKKTKKKTKSERRPFGFGLGANLGDAAATLARAVERLGERFGPLRVAPLYLSEPVSTIPQPDFLNTVVVGETAEPPQRLLAFAQRVERELGRQPAPRDAPRAIDLDLLFVGPLVLRRPGLELPHPRMRGRRFVLAPLADVAPDLALPPDGATPRQLLAALPERPWARRLAAAGTA